MPTTDSMAMEMWKARGRELNALYDVLGPASRSQTGDPVEDLRALIDERDHFGAALTAIVDTDPVDAALDPQRPARIAKQALAFSTNHGSADERQA